MVADKGKHCKHKNDAQLKTHKLIKQRPTTEKCCNHISDAEPKPYKAMKEMLKKHAANTLQNVKEKHNSELLIGIFRRELD